MRTTFIETLIELARKDKDIFLLTGDLGFSVLEGFQKEFPDRFFNMGVAEQSMLSVAAGLALCGKKVYVYSIIPFVTLRCLEQIRNDICYQDVPVKIIGVGSGISYGPSGPTHHSTEDIAIMRSLPNMCVVSPCDPIEVKGAIIASSSFKHPMYIRLAKNKEPKLHLESMRFELGKSATLIEGDDLAIISTGNMVETAIKLSDLLKKDNLDARVISMHTIKPLDTKIILEVANHSKAIFTLEEHNVFGGLGDAVAAVLAENKKHIIFRKIGLPDEFIHKIGGTEYLRGEFGLSVEKILQKIRKVLAEEGILK